jgi:hypothetical protein
MSKQSVYGFPCVENPNDFSPDSECCSPAEIETHRVACANWGKPTFEPNKGSFSQHDAEGKLVMHVCRTSWGIGVNLVSSCDGCGEPDFDGLMTCHECGEQEFCPVCWPKHEKEHESEVR